MQWLAKFQTWWHRSVHSAPSGVVTPWSRSVLVMGLLATTLVGGLRALGQTPGPGQGWLTAMELEAYDWMVRRQADRGPDPRMVIVGITEADLDRYQTPLSDEILAQALDILQSHKPRVIGLDFYRNIQQPPGTEILAAHWENPNLIGIFELGTGTQNGVAPPPLPSAQVGFNDLLLDQDGVVRRLLLLASKEQDHYFSFALRVARHYLESLDPAFVLENDPEHPEGILWGQSSLRPLHANAGAYQAEDDRGYQLLLRYRTPYDIAPTLSLSAVLANGSTLRDQVHNKIVLIGNVAPSSKDLFFTSYTGAKHREDAATAPISVVSARKPYSDMYGVSIHAQITSYLLDMAQGDRLPTRFWPEWAEWGWLALWGFGGALISGRFSHPLHWLGAVGGSGLLLLSIHTGLFSQGIWAPGVAPLLSLGTGAIAMVIYANYQVQREKQFLTQQARIQEASIATLQQLIAPQLSDSPALADPALAPRSDRSIAPSIPLPPSLSHPASYPAPDSISPPISSPNPPASGGGENAKAPGTAHRSPNRASNGAVLLLEGSLTAEPEAAATDFTAETIEDAVTQLPSADPDPFTPASFPHSQAPTDLGPVEGSPEADIDPPPGPSPGPSPQSAPAPSSLDAKASPHGVLAGRYQIRSVLEEGGFGITYIAQDQQRPGQPECVIKRLCPARQDARFLQVARRLFNSEAEILELLGRHDQIPRLLAYFEENYEFYLVQDFIRGQSLIQELQPGQRWSLGHALDFLRGLLPVLGFIHERQVIHRDLKPSNIIHREDGKFVLIDFGAVKYLNAPGKDAAEAKTIAVGTPGYAAPEQMTGHPQLNSDLYSLGMITIQGLIGIPPHLLDLDRHTGTLNWRIHLDRSSPLMSILERLTHVNCIDRYPTATSVLQDLNHL
ncbi:MAG: CHASE2 domain-containing protein [Prochlorothrix sp.]